MMDDALNVHGVYLKVTAREGKHTLVGYVSCTSRPLAVVGHAW